MRSFLQNGNRCLQYLVLPLGHFTRGHATENRRNAKTAQPIWSKCEASDAHPPRFRDDGAQFNSVRYADYNDTAKLGFEKEIAEASKVFQDIWKVNENE